MGTGCGTERPVAGETSPEQVPVAAWAASGERCEGLDLQVLAWVKQEVNFEQPAQEATLLDYLHDVEHSEARIARLDLAIEEAVNSTPAKMCAVIEALQALRGIAQVAAVTIVAELGEVSRFTRAWQLMGYGGIVASEHSSGESTRRGASPRRGMRTYGAWLWRQPRCTATGQT